MPVRVLRAAGVVKVLGGSRVLRGVDASFGAGAPHVIEGANGSGKSTLLAVLGGRSAPTAGRTLLMEGEASLGEGRALRSLVGWLGHELGLYPDLTAKENVVLHASLRGVDAEEAWRSGATSLGIAHVGDRRVRELSRGQRQRVALVRAMVGRSPVLLLDEPSTGLDSATTVRLVEQICSYTAAGDIVVVVTHDPDFRDRLGGQRWILSEGRLSARSPVSRETSGAADPERGA